MDTPEDRAALTEKVAAVTATMKALAKKWADGKISPEEKEALIKALVLRSLGMDM